MKREQKSTIQLLKQKQFNEVTRGLISQNSHENLESKSHCFINGAKNTKNLEKEAFLGKEI